MSVNRWLKLFQDRYGGFPRNYCVLDIETTGLDPEVDLILNIGHVIVRDGRAVSRMESFLDWTRDSRVDHDWLQDRMESTRWEMAQRGREYKMSYEKLVRCGEDPVVVLQRYHDLIKDQQKEKSAFVMHNGYNFDAPWLCTHFHDWLGERLEFGPNEIWDTGMIEKACQLDSVPDLCESMRSWAKRVGGIQAKGVKWSLDAHCVPKYDLERRFNLNVADAHGAGYDSYVTHLLFEEFRRMAMEYKPLAVQPADVCGESSVRMGV